MSRRILSLLRIILGPRGRYVLCWLAALGLTGLHYYIARVSFSSSRLETDPAKVRADDNFGHTLIDFGGQWVMARMLAAGHGPELYNRTIQRREMDAAYPRADEAPGQESGDAQRLFDWM